jgi:dihydroxyacetone kinase-like protein
MTDDTDLLIEVFERVADRLEADADYLTDLDSEIGDADFGVNLKRGVEAAREEVSDTDFDRPDEVLDTIGRTLISEMAGSSGILFGKSLMEGSDALTSGIDYASVVSFAEAYRDNIADQGNVDMGSKTMFDAIQPIVFALKRGSELDDVTALEASANAVKACKYGVAFTIPLRAKKGRASYTEWRSVGHPDPGAVAMLIIVQEIHDSVQEILGEEVKPYLPGDITQISNRT